MRHLGLLLSLLVLSGSHAFASRDAYAPLLGARAWLNGMPSQRDLSGKIVIVDVFTFDCINCKHVVPELRKLNALHSRDLAIIGIHTPETPYERDRTNVADNLRAQGISWPVALDNSYALWNAYGVQYWPTQLIFDRHGNLRKTVIGEGQDDLVAATIAALERERQPMFAAVVLTLAAWPQRDSRAFPDAAHYRLVVRGRARERVALRGDAGDGWIVSFCTPHLCAPRRVSIVIPRSRMQTIDVQAVRSESNAAHATTLRINGGSTFVSAPVSVSP